MNLARVDKIVNAVLYEGYILYPYRPSAIKNRRRFNFGVLVPPDYPEASVMRTECLLWGSPRTGLDVRVRFLQVMDSPSWQEAVEREIILEASSLGDLAGRRRLEFGFSPIEGVVEASAETLGDGLFRLSVVISNRTSMEGVEPRSRDEVLPRSLASTHTILAATGGEFISLLDPPDPFQEAAAACSNVGTWPVLAGERGERDVMLSSPIILYDYPEVAPESPGDLFDGAEIDEILTLRILAMTDEEKREMRDGDERARRILERSEALPEEHFIKLHGALRGLRQAGQGEK